MMHISQRKYPQFLVFFCLFFAIGFFMQPHFASAKLTCPNKSYNQEQLEKVIQVSVPIPGVTFECFDTQNPGEKAGNYTEDMGAYLGGIYKFFSGTIGIIAAGMIFYAGIRWMTAGGNRAHVQSAKETIVTSLVAVALVLGSYLILFTINPKLVNLNPPSIQSIVGKEQNFAQCPTSKTCQDGDFTGKTCKLDSDCGPGVSAGVCAWDVVIAGNSPIDFVFNGGDAKPMCGKEYTYTKAGAGTKTCVGLLCDNGLVCGAANPLDPPGLNSTCMNAQQRCARLTDSAKGVGPGNYDSECQRSSVSGVGMCRWWDEPPVSLVKDGCVWWPPLVCPKDFHQVNCDAPGSCHGDECEGSIRVPKLLGVISADQGDSVSAQYTDIPGRCESAAGESVSSYNDYYSGNAQTPTTVPSICCQSDDDPTEYECVSPGN